ncbi:MAG: zinc ABC transporter substrate-binding protein, partial [Caldilineaceae bacterium]|nr:zinc ABC transporter substrate-binding protein [Caldilineaceae bacterium]
AGCGSSRANARDTQGPIQVVATVGQLADIAQIVGGDHAQVTGLMGAGVDPHLYVATEGDVDLLQNADIIFYNGLFLEAQLDQILKQLAERKTVTAVGETIDPALLLPWAGHENQFDPHIWFDVTLWMKAVEAVRDTYAQFDPDHAAGYEANAAAYLKELEALHAYVQEQAERVPDAQRVLITAHDAFHYFGRAYGFDVRGLQGISTATEAGTADVRDLANFIVEHKIPSIFIESSVPVRNVEALQAAVKAQGYNVTIGGSLFSDAMGNPGTPEGTYIGMVRHNIDTIVGALLGEQP